MKQHKLIIFDWGEIVESHYDNYGTSHAFNDLFKSLGYKGNLDIFSSLKKYKLSSIGNIKDLEKAYNEIKNDFKLNGSFTDFINNYKKFTDKIYYYKDVVEYEHSLKDKCYIGILSNLVILDKERIDKQLDLSKYDYTFLSFEMKTKKPNEEIYKKVEEETKFKPTDILLIDDSPKNIDTAKKLGWNTLIATGKELEKIKSKCQSFIEKAKY